MVPVTPGTVLSMVGNGGGMKPNCHVLCALSSEGLGLRAGGF